MALSERFFPLIPMNFDFFRHFEHQMNQEMAQMEQEMQRARGCLLQLLPRSPVDVTIQDIKPAFPVVEERGESKLKLEFNVQKFKPDELEVKLLGNRILQVSALHQEQSESGSSKISYLRQYTIPEGVDVEHLKPQLLKDGVLIIEAPAPALKPSERMIPIEYKTDK